MLLLNKLESYLINPMRFFFLVEMLQEMLTTQQFTWIPVYLTGRPQFVLSSGLCEVVVCDTEALRGLVLSPFLLPTTDFLYNSELCYLPRFSDDFAVAVCIKRGR